MDLMSRRTIAKYRGGRRVKGRIGKHGGKSVRGKTPVEGAKAKE